MGRKHGLRRNLVHSDGRSKDSASHIRCADQFEKTLNRSILTEGTMKEREDNGPGRRCHGSGNHRRRRNQRSDGLERFEMRGIVAALLPGGDGTLRDVPVTRTVDADRRDDVRGRVESSQDMCSGHTTDIVLGRTSPEDDHDVEAIVQRLSHAERLYRTVMSPVSSQSIRRIGAPIAVQSVQPELLIKNYARRMAGESGNRESGSRSTSRYLPDPHFLAHHGLRIKGFATSSAVADIVALAVSHVESSLQRLAESGLAVFREARSLWQLTPDGKEAHRRALADDVRAFDLDTLRTRYGSFLEVNEDFKTLCGQWQLRDGEPNDHCDAAHDADVISRLVELDRRAQPIVSAMVEVVPRLAPYGPRLSVACSDVQRGEFRQFTGVMCGSYHDIWMELHEDLILTQGIDRSAEGSF